MFCASFHFSEKAVFSAISAVRRLRHTFFLRARDPTCRGAITITGCEGLLQKSCCALRGKPLKSDTTPRLRALWAGLRSGQPKKLQGAKSRCKNPFLSRKDVSVAALLPFFVRLLTTHPGIGPAKHPPNLSMEAAVFGRKNILPESGPANFAPRHPTLLCGRGPGA